MLSGDADFNKMYNTAKSNYEDIITPYIRFANQEETFKFSLTGNKNGGDKDNAIPALAKAHIIIDEDDLANVKKFTRDFTADVRKEYAGTDDEIKKTKFSKIPKEFSRGEASFISAQCAKRITMKIHFLS